MPDATEPKSAKTGHATEEIARVRQLAKLAHELRCEISLGHITVRPMPAEPASEQARGLLAMLKAPVLAFFERL